MNFHGWVDHDGEHEQSILRALGAAKGHDARDELGLGTIRDSFADLLFPGLSTIQERVRYFLFVQWCCEIAARQGDAERIVDERSKRGTWSPITFAAAVGLAAHARRRGSEMPTDAVPARRVVRVPSEPIALTTYTAATGLQSAR